MKENLINKQAQIDHENDQLQNQNQHIHPEQQDQLNNNQELSVQRTQNKASDPNVNLKITPDQKLPQNTHLWPSIPENINTKSARVTLHKHIAVSVEFGNHHHNIYAGGGVSSKDLISILGPLLQEYDILDEEKEKCSENNKDDKATNKVNYDQSDVSHNDTVNENTVVQEKNHSHKPKQGTTERNEKVHVLSTTWIESQIAECEPEHNNINNIAKDVTRIDLAIEADPYQYSNTANSEVSGSANNKAFSFGGIAKAERRAENKQKEQKSVNKHSLLNKVVKAIFTTRSSSVPTHPDPGLPHVAPEKGKSRNRPKDEKRSEKDTEIVQMISDGVAAHPFTIYDNCRTNLYLDNQITTPKNLVHLLHQTFHTLPRPSPRAQQILHYYSQSPNTNLLPKQHNLQ